MAAVPLAVYNFIYIGRWHWFRHFWDSRLQISVATSPLSPLWCKLA